MSNLIAGIEHGRAGAELIAMSTPDIGTIVKVGGGLLTVATAGFSAVRAFRQIPEKHVGIRTFNGRATDKDGNMYHELLLPGGHWMLPLLHDVELVKLQPETTEIATTFDVHADNGIREQFNLEATATWGVAIDLEGDPEDAFWHAYNYHFGLSSFEDVQTKVSSTIRRYMVQCATALPPEQRTFAEVASYATNNLEIGVDLNEIGVSVYEIELNAFYRAGVIQFGGNN